VYGCGGGGSHICKNVLCTVTTCTLNEAVDKIEELTGIKRSPTQVRKFLKSMGMKCLKVGSLPSKADPDEQEEYKEKKLEPRLNKTKQGKRSVFLLMPLTLLWELFSVLFGVLRDFWSSHLLGVNA
jgi:hypothetical protein